MLKKIFISAILLIAVLSFVVSLLSGKNSEEKVIAAPTDRVAVINIGGTIVSGDPGENIWGKATGASSGRLMREIREAAADSSVKALVLRIDSPGGSVTAAEEVGRELKRFKETTNKPIITSMGDSAASAAYWLAAYSDTIYANPSTLTGSIGVYMPYMNTQELFQKIGIYTTKIKSGQYKDIMSSDRPMTPEEQQILQNMINQMFEEFVGVIAEGRKMDVAKVKSLADGRVYTGRQAQALGLVDELGNYYDALGAAGKAIGVDGIPEIKENKRQKPWEVFFSAQLSKMMLGHLEMLLQKDAAGIASPQAAR